MSTKDWQIIALTWIKRHNNNIDLLEVWYFISFSKININYIKERLMAYLYKLTLKSAGDK